MSPKVGPSGYRIRRSDVRQLREARLDPENLQDWHAWPGLLGTLESAKGRSRVDSTSTGGRTTQCVGLGALSTRPAVNDTSVEIEAVLKARFAAMSGSQRALMAMQMFETAQRIVLSSLDPAASERERRRELCRRFYGDELARAAFPETALSNPAASIGITIPAKTNMQATRVTE